MKYILLILIIIGCNSNHLTPEVHITNELFNKITHEYISAIASKKKNNYIITMFLKKEGDTLCMSMINSYPDLTEARLNGISKFEKYSICFLGEQPPESFFSLGNNMMIPKHLLEKNNEISKKANIPETTFEPVLWTFYFIKNKLVDYFPKDKISVKCDICMDSLYSASKL